MTAYAGIPEEGGVELSITPVEALVSTGRVGGVRAVYLVYEDKYVRSAVWSDREPPLVKGPAGYPFLPYGLENVVVLLAAPLRGATGTPVPWADISKLSDVLVDLQATRR